jgi:MFS family permease
VVVLSPPAHQGLAMALFSQCFAVSAFAAPLLAGRLLDGQGHGAGVWLLLLVAVLLSLPLVNCIASQQRNRLLAVLSGAAGDNDNLDDAPEVLYRLGPPAAGSDPLA